jgi:hypothetical protein
VTATLFTLRQGEAGRVVGLALAVPEARYISCRLASDPRLARRFASTADWRAIVEDLRTIPPTPLPAASAVARVLAGDWNVRVQYVTRHDVEAATPGELVRALDALLLEQPLDGHTNGGDCG